MPAAATATATLPTFYFTGLVRTHCNISPMVEIIYHQALCYIASPFCEIKIFQPPLLPSTTIYIYIYVCVCLSCSFSRRCKTRNIANKYKKIGKKQKKTFFSRYCCLTQMRVKGFIFSVSTLQKKTFFSRYCCLTQMRVKGFIFSVSTLAWKRLEVVHLASPR